MTQHIGIVACSAEGAALCYRSICAEAPLLLGPHAHPELSLHSHSLADYVACLERGDLPGVAELMLSSAHKLAAAGADFLICPDNTIHQALALVLPRSPLPWLHIAGRGGRRSAAARLPAYWRHRPRWLVGSAVYPDAFGTHGLAWPGRAPVTPSRMRCSASSWMSWCAASSSPRPGAFFSG